jgi:hypothetical protein
VLRKRYTKWTRKKRLLTIIRTADRFGSGAVLRYSGIFKPHGHFEQKENGKRNPARGAFLPTCPGPTWTAQ